MQAHRGRLELCVFPCNEHGIRKTKKHIEKSSDCVFLDKHALCGLEGDWCVSKVLTALCVECNPTLNEMGFQVWTDNTSPVNTVSLRPFTIFLLQSARTVVTVPIQHKKRFQTLLQEKNESLKKDLFAPGLTHRELMEECQDEQPADDVHVEEEEEEDRPFGSGSDSDTSEQEEEEEEDDDEQEQQEFNDLESDHGSE
jgi:hypothetical protein